MFYVHDDIIELIDNDRVKFISSIETSPFSVEHQVGPGSIDLRLGFSFLKFKTDAIINENTSDDTLTEYIKPSDTSITIQPGEIILTNTLETVFLPSDIGAFVTGRSSVSKLGLQINISQDFIQPGYVNTIPLQLVNLHKDKPINIPTSISICQLILFQASSQTSIPYSISEDSKYGKATSVAEPSKLGIEFGLNSQEDFEVDKSLLNEEGLKNLPMMSEDAQKKIERWKKKLETEAKAAKRASKYRNTEVEIGIYLATFLGKPNVSDGSSKGSSVREDSLYSTIQDFLNTEKENLKLLDVCCGKVSWLQYLQKAVNGNISKIEYLGIDSSLECKNQVLLNPLRGEFAAFDCKLAEAHQLKGIGKFHIVWISNSLHEIEPSLYPALFESMNSVLIADKGKIIITDMVELPENEIESKAITWSGKEFTAIMLAGGFECYDTTFQKVVDVFQLKVSASKKVNKREMLLKIKELLINKRKTAIEYLEHLETDFRETTIYRMEWLKAAGLIARISMSIKKINDQLPKSLQQNKQ